MAAEDILEQVQGVVASIFRKGSRHQAEKLATVLGFLFLSIGSVIWALSGTNPNNELGASFGPEKIEEIDRNIFFLENNSGEDWTNVRVVLNRQFLYKTKDHEAGKRSTLGPQNFQYFYFIPRNWGINAWESLETKPKPDRLAPSTIDADLVQIRADQGRIDITPKK